MNSTTLSSNLASSAGTVGECGLDELGEAILADLDHGSILPDAVWAAPASPTMLNGFSGPHRLAA